MTTVLVIDGMRSVHSVRAVFTALAGVEGIARAHVTAGRAVVEHDEPLDPGRLREAVALAGCELAEVIAERRRLPTL